MRLIFLGSLEIMGHMLQTTDFVHEIVFADFDAGQQGRLLHLTAADGSLLYDGVVLSPEAALRQSYDYVVVYTAQPLQEVYTHFLGRFAVPVERVMDYRYFYQHCGAGVVYQEADVLVLAAHLRELSVKSILDEQLFLSSGPHFTCPPALAAWDFYGVADSVGADRPVYKNLYRRIFASRAEAETRQIDALLLTRQISLEEYCRWMEANRQRFRYLIAYVYRSSSAYDGLRRLDYSTWWDARWLPAEYGSWLLLDRGCAGKCGIEVYVVTHKPTALPLLGEMYIPLQAGRALHDSLGCLDDAAGDNISALNPYLNECTALYWIWKHAAGNYLGMVHYRRYFAEPDNPQVILEQDSAAALLEKYDILVVREWIMAGSTELQLQMDLGMDTFQRILAVFRQAMKKNQPEYLAAMEYVLSGRGFFRCNMFITHRQYFRAYCQWLFSFLLEVMEQLRPQLDGEMSTRAVGFFAERMLTVWLLRQELRIGELPILELTEK